MDKQEFLAELKRISQETYALIGEFLKKQPYLTEAGLAEITGCYLRHPGKALRPALVTFACQATGGTEEQSRYAAASVEMFHTWTLMADDIIDHDDFRRGQPAAHVQAVSLAQQALGIAGDSAQEFGRGLAMLGSNALEGLAGQMLARTPAASEQVLALVTRMYGKLNPELLSGEQMDVRLSYVPWEDVRESEIIEMMRLKTGALLAFCAETGAAIGSGLVIADPPQGLLAALGRFATLCGLAFQLSDDLLGVFGDAQFGKPIGSDIREGKRTLLMLRTLTRLTDSDRRQMLGILGNSAASDAEIEHARWLIQQTNAEQEVRGTAEAYVAEAIELLHAQLPPSHGRDCLEAWANVMVARKV